MSILIPILVTPILIIVFFKALELLVMVLQYFTESFSPEEVALVAGEMGDNTHY